METKEVQLGNINTTLIKTNKFKTISIQIVFLGEYTKETATLRSLLVRLLSTSTKLYPTKKALANVLMDMYDAAYSISTYPSGLTSVTVFGLDIVNEKNIGVPGLTQESFNFLKEAIFNPHLEEGLFPEKNFLEQKRILKERIQNIYNNKNRYALRQLLNKMAPEQIISVSSLGNLEDLEKVTNEDLVRLYKQMILEENVSIYVVGDFEETEISAGIKSLGKFNSNEKKYPTVLSEVISVESVREFVEKQNLNQSKLLMGFRSDINTKSSLYAAALVFNAMYGGTFASDLIRVVREENSLAYTIASQFMTDVMVLIVSAGIDGDKYQLTSDLVIKQLELYKQGHLDSDLLEISKENLVNELNQFEDNPYSLSSFALRNYLHDLTYSISDLIAAVKATTLEEIQTVAKGINLDTIFLLTSEGKDA